MNERRPDPVNARAFHADEDGLVSLVSTLAVLGLLVLFAILANVGKSVNQKIEVQTGADAAAATAANQFARGMNEVTAINHMIGELHGLVVIHHAFGGDELEGTKQVPETPVDVKYRLRLSYELANALADEETQFVLDQSYEQIKKEPEVGGAIWDCQIRLKKVASWAYTVHAVGGFIVRFKVIPLIGPILQAIGHAIAGAASAFEGKALAEWYTLHGISQVVQNTQMLKEQIQTALIPGLNAYALAIAGTTGELSARPAVEATGKRNGVTASFDYRSLLSELPVVAEPDTLDVGKSQLMRASTPWTQYWRNHWMRFGKDALLLSRFDAYYLRHTDEFQKVMTERAKKDHGVNLLILEGTDPAGPDKGAETWTTADGSREADELFAVVGFAHRPAKPPIGGRVFRQPTPDGVATYAQALVYNANPQRPTAGPAGWQKRVGWDTLNWVVDVPEYPGPGNRVVEPAEIPNIPLPQIRVNWQAKLVPATTDRLRRAFLMKTFAPGTDPGLRRIINRTYPDRDLARTH